MISIGHDSVCVFLMEGGGWSAELIEWLIEGQAFSRSFSFAPRPPPLPPSPVRNLDRRHTGRLRKRGNFLKGEGGRGWARSRIIRPQKSLVLYKSFFNTLWWGGMLWLECDCVCMRMVFLQFKVPTTLYRKVESVKATFSVPLFGFCLCSVLDDAGETGCHGQACVLPPQHHRQRTTGGVASTS